jgi:hypothetical protein
MFNRYAVVYGDYVTARVKQKIQLKPWIKLFSSVNAARAATVWTQDGRISDVNDDRSYWHDEEEKAILPPVVWADTPCGGAVGLQWWSKDRYCWWIITERKFFGYHRLPLNEITLRSEQSTRMLRDMRFAIELARATDVDKKEILARHAAEMHEFDIYWMGARVASATQNLMKGA